MQRCSHQNSDSGHVSEFLISNSWQSVIATHKNDGQRVTPPSAFLFTEQRCLNLAVKLDNSMIVEFITILAITILAIVLLVL